MPPTVREIMALCRKWTQLNERETNKMQTAVTMQKLRRNTKAERKWRGQWTYGPTSGL